MQAGEPSGSAAQGAARLVAVWERCAEFRLVELQLSEFVSSHRLSWADLRLQPHTRTRAAVRLQHRSEVNSSNGVHLGIVIYRGFRPIWL